MPRAAPPSAAFVAIRDALLALEDGDRRRLTGLYGSMTERLPDPTPQLRAFIVAIGALDTTDHLRLAKWIRSYVSRWGQVPAASSYSVKVAPRHEVPQK
jgi:hypothetical protein